MLRVGSEGDDVKALQKALLRKGINCGAVDGIFGPKTAAAVKRYQEREGLAVDGIVGPNTMAAMGIGDDDDDAAESGSAPSMY
jgi:N-acetylmuramoyl-L-alanine amidase